jgi:exopolysaccharide biosynthesis polyprenyl glycosylphosphotransferase
LTLLFDLVGRYAARKWLHHRRRCGTSMTSVVAIGGAASVAEFTALLRRDRHAGLRVVGACLPHGAARDGAGERELGSMGVPVVGDVDSILHVVRTHGAQSVAVLSGDISAEKLRWISWQLEGTDTDLVVSPGLTEFGGRRLHVQPVAGLPLLHIEQPEFSGFRRIVKATFDRVVAGIGLLVLSPLFLILAALVAGTSKGSPFFLQTRVGRDGETFRMVKFRSMYSGAERRVSELLSQNEAADGLLFKIRDDPRVTPIGRRLRRYSLDELPQLVNVFMGSMSLVGPRPPLPTEVAQYGYEVSRRLLVKPGITGLWQISGRSDLSWEESVRLDLRYVEDWSLALDLVVLLKTAKAVFGAAGAY